jgi:hypothetical protein
MSHSGTRLAQTMEVKSVMDDFIGRTVTNLHLIGTYIVAFLLLRINVWPCSVFPLVNWCGQVPWLFIIDTCSAVFFNMLVHWCTLHCMSEHLSPYYADSLVWISTPRTPSVHKENVISCFI